MDKKGNSGACAPKPLVISKKQWLLKRPDIDEMAESGGSALKKRTWLLQESRANVKNDSFNHIHQVENGFKFRSRFSSKKKRQGLLF